MSRANEGRIARRILAFRRRGDMVRHGSMDRRVFAEAPPISKHGARTPSSNSEARRGSGRWEFATTLPERLAPFHRGGGMMREGRGVFAARFPRRRSGHGRLHSVPHGGGSPAPEFPGGRDSGARCEGAHMPRLRGERAISAPTRVSSLRWRVPRRSFRLPPTSLSPRGGRTAGSSSREMGRGERLGARSGA